MGPGSAVHHQETLHRVRNTSRSAYASRSILLSVGNSFIHNSAIAIVPGRPKSRKDRCPSGELESADIIEEWVNGFRLVF
jgi:hypothetical protein